MITIRCTKPDKAGLSHTLLTGKTYTVGRKEADIVLEDNSISRRHAEIIVEHPLANMTDPLLTPTLVVTDLGSKFGTFVNTGIEHRSKMSMREAVNLSPGDRFKFGVQWNEYKIEYTQLIVTPSAVKDAGLKKLKTAIMTLGGHLVQEWLPSCDYVVMENLSLTLKVVCAMFAAKYIVTPEFFEDMLECIKTRKGIPNPNNYLPPLAEKGLSSDVTFEPITARSELLSGKVFVFVTSKHLKKMGPAVEAGGGACLTLHEVSDRDLMKENYILMKPSERDLLCTNDHARETIDMYAKSKRLVQDSELGLAAVNMGIEKNCNPYYSFDEVLPRVQTQSQDPLINKTIVPPTQEQTSTTGDSSEDDSIVIVEETVLREAKDVKVKIEGAATKRHTDVGDETGSASKKRTADSSFLRPEPPGKRSRVQIQPPKKTQPSGLSAIFGMSDSEDDEEEEVVILATPTTPISNQRASDSAAHTRAGSMTMDMDPSSDVEAVPDSPEMFFDGTNDVQPSEVVVASSSSPEKRVTRSGARSPQKESQTTTLLSSTIYSGRSKRKHQSPDVSPVKIVPKEKGQMQPVAKKQKTKEPNNEDLGEKIENLTMKPKVDCILNSDSLPPAPTVKEVQALLCKGPKIQPKLEKFGGRTVKNFKTFKKVLPLSMRNKGGSSDSGASSIATIPRPRMNLTFEVYDYTPETQLRKSNQVAVASSPAPVANFSTQAKRKSTLEEAEDNGMAIDDIMPEFADQNTTRNNRRTRATAAAIANTNKKQQENCPQPSTSSQRPKNPSPPRRTSPRKNPPVQQLILVDDDADGMFDF